MNRVLVIGCPGSGKSTFARRLRDKTGIALYYLDMIWHKPDRTSVTTEEFDAKLADILRKGNWIIDGNYSRTLETRLKACDAVFFFDIPIPECISGVAARIGLKREDMPWIEYEFDEEFRQYILDFSSQQLPEIRRTIGRFSDIEKYVFHSRAEADNYIDDLKP